MSEKSGSLEYVLLPRCQRQVEHRSFLDEAIVPEGEPEPVYDCPKCGLPRWLSVPLSVASQYEWTTTPVDDGAARVRFSGAWYERVRDVRFEISLLDSLKWQPVNLADMWMPDWEETARESFGLRKAVACQCLKGGPG